MPKYLSADDLLAGITGEAIDYEVPGLGAIQLRALSFAEVSKTRGLVGDELALNRAIVKMGIVCPELNDDQVAHLMDASAGVVGKIVQRVMQLSGMIEDDELKNEVGAGS